MILHFELFWDILGSTVSKLIPPNRGKSVKVAYVFALPRSASYKLAQMILPQLEAGTHGVDVAGMFFFGLGHRFGQTSLEG